MKILVTGGVGFIGSHLIDKLVELQFEVFSLDRTSPGKYQNPRCNYITRDICDPLDDLMKEQFDVIYHLASEVGSGLSMADPLKFVNANNNGTCNLLESMRRSGKMAKVIVASSATVYGEATYESPEYGICYPDFRPLDQLERGEWELKCPKSGKDMKAVAIKENRILMPASIYGESKLSQEWQCLLLGRTWGFPVVAFRLFGVFGPRQSLGNPYTGVLALFATKVFSGKNIIHYEDGLQNKGYTYIDDVINAFLMTLDSSKGDGMAMNLGLPKPVTIKRIAELLIQKINPDVSIISKGQYRISDTRHSWPDTSLANQEFGWTTKVSFEEGMDKMIEWLKTLPQDDIYNSLDNFAKAEQYALKHGLPV